MSSRIVQNIEPRILEGLDQNQERAALALTQTSFRPAIDLLENPARAPGWTYEDPVVLESQGRLSRQIVRAIGKIAADRPELNLGLQQSGAFLCIGSGRELKSRPYGMMISAAAIGIPRWRHNAEKAMTAHMEPHRLLAG